MHYPLFSRILLLSALASFAAVTARAQSPAPPAKAAAAKPKPAASAKSPAVKAGAQPAPAPAVGLKPEDRAREMTTSMTQALGLAAPQVTHVQAINLLSVQRVEEARRTFARKLPRMRAEIELIGNSRLSLLKDVLTEQQFRTYAAMREKKMGIPEALKEQAKMSESASGE